MPLDPFSTLALLLKGREYAEPMSYIVEIRREREHLAQVMSAVREWLDAQRFEPDAFRCDQEGKNIVCRLEFKFETEARACADAFHGQVGSIDDA
jgi:hypothetical protein